MDGRATGAVVGSVPRLPFSLEQDFLRLQHENDGTSAGFGPRPISSGGWRLTGPWNSAVMARAIKDVVARHEALRTTIEAGPEGWCQRVHEPAAAPLLVRELSMKDGQSREERAEEFLNEIEAANFDVTQVPCLSVYVGRLDARDAVVVLVSHLPVVDVWSLGIVMKDIVTCYEARLAGKEPGEGQVHQYREYVHQQIEAAAEKSSNASFGYWRERLAGARAIALRADRPPAQGPIAGTRCDRFTVDAQLGTAALDLAKSMRCSPFMVLFSAYRVHLLRLTGMLDGVVWTLTSGPGRRRRWMEETVGYFVNMFPLRTDIADCQTFRDVITRVRTTGMEALRHEVPFVQLAQQASTAISELEQGGMVVPGFQMSPNPFVLRAQSAGEVGCSAVQRRLSQEVGPDIPDDAILFTAEVGHAGDLLFAVNSSIDRYDPDTIEAMLADFRTVLRAGVTTPDAPLDSIEGARH